MIARTGLIVLATAISVCAQGIGNTHVHQAEQAKLSGVTVGTSVAGYSGNISKNCPV
jgi:hypothetical protein